MLLGISNISAANAPIATPLDIEQLPTAMPAIAAATLAAFDEKDPELRLNSLFRLQLVAGQDDAALKSIAELRQVLQSKSVADADIVFAQYEIFLRARLRQQSRAEDFPTALASAFKERFKKFDDRQASRAVVAFDYSLDRALLELKATLAEVNASKQISGALALTLVRRYQPYFVYQQLLPLTQQLVDADHNRRYVIDKVQIPGKAGVSLTAHVVRPRALKGRQPTALNFTIYALPRFGANVPIPAAAEGFISVLAFSRGKGDSKNDVAPYEHEVDDVNTVIDWIARQPWSNGEVGMYGGSYEGFSQWAATKRLHPALKTIVPYVAAIPGLGLPMENNVFLNANYGWAFYVGNNRYLDDAVYQDRERWNELDQRWFESGRPYRQFDRVDGTANPWLQRWLKHPSYDRYWQRMVPYAEDYARINIPVLSITGYYDDGQISALHYLREHERFNPDANHFLVIGPYDHFGAQNAQKERVLRGYSIDPVAQFSTPELTFAWLNHILRGAPKPAMLKNRINFQIMGSNTWGGASSLAALHSNTKTFYLDPTADGSYFSLTETKPARRAAKLQTVDFADREVQTNAYYPGSVISDKVDIAGGVAFVSKPLTQAITIAGSFSGQMDVRINKRDFDLGVVLYELTANGEVFHLSYYLGRASYAKDMTRRNLLQPGKVESIPFARTRMVARQLNVGSRLLVVVNVNKNSGAQVNYGTGGDVSDESIKNAGKPLEVEWLNSSRVVIPVVPQGR